MNGRGGNEKLYHLFQKLKLEGMHLYYPFKGIIFLPEPQRTEELEKNVKWCVKHRRYSDALIIADLLDEPRRTSELTVILEGCIEDKDFYTAHKVADALLKHYEK